VQGDTWDMIAYRLYPQTGRESNMPRLIEANSEYADYVIFPAGIVIYAPDEVFAEYVNVPPWRR
ncbi:MAG: tail protein X, partial [Synergistaceae bacterium]|nr:tail protein X [Synergistaceae bacterium]